MNEQLLTCDQVFSLKPETLKKRIMEFYQETQNSSVTIKYILALRVRFKLGAQEFAHILEDLVRYLFMNTKATRTKKNPHPLRSRSQGVYKLNFKKEQVCYESITDCLT